MRGLVRRLVRGLSAGVQCGDLVREFSAGIQ